MNQPPAADGPGSGTYVGGSVTGNGIAVGAGASAAYTSMSAPADESHQALLKAVRDLSEDLKRYPPPPRRRSSPRAWTRPNDR
ncbi:hypothetical protein WKI71_27275 [Streptomyces sp. MS1.AVA.1]|uniref:Uncharacterized protein n=1 Tax=Streptomyces machairae TaxID=3134109 RepID=A0ABU8UPC9_9ACTN